MKEDTSVINQEAILVDQLRAKRGGQLAEFETSCGQKKYRFAICQLPSEKWVIVACKSEALPKQTEQSE